MIWSVWWVWVAGALVLGILEMVIPAYIFLGFAMGALAVGLLLALFSLTGPWAFVLFAVFSLLAYVALRLAFGLPHGQVKTFDRDINDN
jgi:membrane protein implicated in regulation of membrane protease activity